MNQFDVPVLFCTFNRLECTKKVFERIREIKPAKLYLLSDGPRENVSKEEEKVFAVRKYLEKNIDWECLVFRNFAEKNMGCGKRMASGISWAFEQEEKLIIIEDDCLPNLSFFRYCKELLELYKDDENIMLVGGSNSVGELNEKDSFVFSPFIECWGWATWRRTWQQYDYDILDWREREVPQSMREVMSVCGGEREKIEYYSSLFDSVYTHELDTWDYQLQYLVFQKGALTIVPRKCLVKNIGFGQEATHTKTVPVKLYSEDDEMSFPLQIPSQVKNSEEYNRGALKAFFP